MAVEGLTATAVNNLNAVPPVRATAGVGGAGRFVRQFATLKPTTAEVSTSTYDFIRVPSSAILSSIRMWLDTAMTTFTGNLGLYYSSNWADGTDANAGVAGTSTTAMTGSISTSCFQAALALAAVTSPTEYLMGGAITSGLLGTPAWKMAGLTSDPGGFFDIVFGTTTTNSGSQPVNMVVEYFEQGGAP